MVDKILKNKAILGFSIREHNNCSLQLSEAYSITAECLVRFKGKGDVFICANDHGQLFGLKSPFDAESSINRQLKGKIIKAVTLDQDSGDLKLHLDSGVLELICNSSGYECYQINGPKNLIVVVHGGKQK